MPTLTDAACKKAQLKEKAYKLFDGGGGLHLWVSSKGAKVWRVAYRFQGKPKTMSLGDYPLIPLAQARIKLSEIKANLLSGHDPMGKRTQARELQKKDANTVLFKDACEQYWEDRKDVSDNYRMNASRGLEMHLFPSMGNKSIKDITRDDLLTALRVMDSRGLHVYVRNETSASTYKAFLDRIQE